MKSITNAQGAIQIREVFYPGGAADAGGRRARQVRRLLDQGHPRHLRLRGRHRGARRRPASGRRSSTSTTSSDRMQELKAQLEDDNHNVYFTGFPWLYTSIQRYVPEVGEVFVVTVRRAHVPPVELLPLAGRACGCRCSPGILSSIWALGMVPLLGSEPRPARPGGPDLPLGARALALRAVDGPLSRGVPPHRRPAHGDRRVVLAPLPAGDRVDPERRHRPPPGVDGAHPPHPEGAPSSPASGSSRSSSAWSRCTRSSCRRPTRPA